MGSVGRPSSRRRLLRGTKADLKGGTLRSAGSCAVVTLSRHFGDGCGSGPGTRPGIGVPENRFAVVGTRIFRATRMYRRIAAEMGTLRVSWCMAITSAWHIPETFPRRADAVS